MSKANVDFDTVKDVLMQDKEFEKEYRKLNPRYEIIAQIIAARNEENLTQEQLANRTGTKKSNISRLERGSYNPSLDYLVKIAEGLGKEIHVELRDINNPTTEPKKRIVKA